MESVACPDQAESDSGSKREREWSQGRFRGVIEIRTHRERERESVRERAKDRERERSFERKIELQFSSETKTEKQDGGH